MLRHIGTRAVRLHSRWQALPFVHSGGAGFGPSTSGRFTNCDAGRHWLQQHQMHPGPWMLECRALSGDGRPVQTDSSSQVLTLPTILTIGRVIAIPFVVAAWYWPSPWATPALTALFIAAAVTDWLDGYLARKLNASSTFGAFLDPVADKLMVGAVLILLTTQPLSAGPLAGNHWLIPICTLAILGREISMSALREWAATLGGEARNAVAVNNMGKWKTATQMVSLTLLLATRDGGAGHMAVYGGTLGVVLLLAATYLTVHSLVVYFRALWPYMA